jgi:hypothetical protein
MPPCLLQPLSSLWRQFRNLAEDADFLVCLFLLAAAIGSLKFIQGDSGAALAGALIGAFAVLVGNWINRRNELRRRNEDREDRIRNTKTLVAAELVNVASGMISTEETLSGYVRAFLAGAAVHEQNDLAYLSPRPMPRTANLAGDLLLLDRRDIDVLATLESNLAITRRNMDEVTRGQTTFSLLSAQQLVGMVRHDLNILAQAFEQFAPDRQCALSGRPPELTTVLLRRLSQRQD